VAEEEEEEVEVLVQDRVFYNPKSKLFEIAKQAILGETNLKSNRSTKLQSEVRSPLFLYRK